MVIPGSLAFTTTFAAATIIAGLYFARELLVPLALAVLLSFILAPIVRLLHRWYFPRALAVCIAVVFALGIILSLGAMVVSQVNQLASDLPQYQTTLRDKIHNLREFLGSSRVLVRTSDLLKDLSKELDAPAPPAISPNPTVRDNLGTKDADSARPLPVEIRQPVPGAFETLFVVLRPLAGPLTTTGIVIIFVIFFLFQREDLRNRFIRLAGAGDLQRTTTALDDAGYRLGRLFLTQLLLNSAFGAVIGIGLAVIGVPSAALWGLLAMLLRFVPYIGAVLAALFPLILAAAVGPGWSMVLWTALLFAVVEPLTGHIVEPLVYGPTSGLSPVAIVLSAAFWTWLWGPLGLLLSTPLTLCLVVLARHVEKLSFLDVLLGDQPALTPPQIAYQRLLAGDPVETVDQAAPFQKKGELPKYYEEILLGALRLAQLDAEQGRLDDARLQNILQTVVDAVEDFGDEPKPVAGVTAPNDGTNVITLVKQEFLSQQRIVCIPGMGRLDEAASVIVAAFLRLHGLNASHQTSTPSRDNQAPILCICFLQDVTEGRLNYLSRRILRSTPSVQIVVASLGPSAMLENHDGRPVPRDLNNLAKAVMKLLEPKEASRPLSR